MSVDTGLLQQTELFRTLEEDDLAQVAAVSAERQVRREETLFREGEVATGLYLITKGAVALRKLFQARPDQPPRETVVTVCQPGEFAGWSALVEPYEYSVTAVVREPGTLIVVDTQSLRKLLDARPGIGYKVMAVLATVITRRLQQTEEKLMSERALVIAESARRPRA